MSIEHSYFLWGLGVLQAVMVILLGWIKRDQSSIKKEFKDGMKEVWGRVNFHGHDIDCDANGCKPRTTAVLIKEPKE